MGLSRRLGAMDTESFPYIQTTDRQQTTDNYRHARSDKGEAANGVALKTEPSMCETYK